MPAWRALMAVAVLATLLPPSHAASSGPSPAASMQVLLVDDGTLLWSAPLLDAEHLASARTHVFGLDAAGNATLLSVEPPGVHQARVPPGFARYGVAVEKEGGLGAMVTGCYVIYLHRVPPAVVFNCAPPVPDVPPVSDAPPVPGPPDKPVRPMIWVSL